MTILGLNAYHGDAAACLVRDGQLVAAAEEERFRRIKHWAGFPAQAIEYCLKEGGIKISDVDHVAVNRKPGVNNLRRLAFVLTHWPDPRLVMNRIRNIRKASTIEDAIRMAFPGQTIRAHVHHVEHHMAHLGSAYLVSDFGEAVCLSVDGFGDFASAAWGMGRGREMTIDGRVYFPHSLGIFYSAITQFLGFPHFGDEYKVMGLAPYGQPNFLAEMRKIVLAQRDGTFRLNLKYFRHHRQNVAYTWNDCAPEVGILYSEALYNLLGPARQKDQPLEQKHRDLASSAQTMYEEAFFALLNALHRKYGCNHLALAGGCAMNSVANGKVYLKTPFTRMYVPASSGDAGGAIGAAYAVWQMKDGRWKMGELGDGTENSKLQTPNSSPESLRGSETRDYRLQASSQGTASARGPLAERGQSTASHNGRFVMRHAYTGPGFSNSDFEALLNSRGLLARQNGCEVSRIEDSARLCSETAKYISEGKVVGWFQGRMEWGPRALGNRSILGDPRRADMKEILNNKIKRRESFRPFAPSILRERVAEWFEQEDDVPFMMQVFQVRPEKRSLVPATTHVDGSGRLQTVHRETNPLYWRLISEFQRLTGIPMVLNTSFNENEPVVCRPEEALDCFLRTKMDALVLGNFVLRRGGLQE